MRLFKLRKNERGQSMVEFALVLPILIFLVMGIIEFGWLYNGQITLTSAAREGARVMVVTKNQTKATLAAEKAITGSGLQDLNVGFLDADTNAALKIDTDNVKVKVEAKLVPIIGFWIKKTTVDMESIAIMRNE